jgi:nitrogen fixation/metabolism regulation signal transduction histidine kinase
VFLSLICGALFMTSVMSACSKTQRTDTIHASLIALNAARDGLTEWDRVHQHDIIDTSKTREEATTTLAAYRARRDSVVAGFEVAYRALALAATQNDDPSLHAALLAATTIVESVKSLIGNGSAVVTGEGGK